MPRRSRAPKPYRFHPITLRFMRSVARAHARGVRARLDGRVQLRRHAQHRPPTPCARRCSTRSSTSTTPRTATGRRGALGAIFDAVAKKCGTSIPCLAPYTPNETIVRGGTYYSFQPGNGVVEYAAELALRYYREQRAALRNLPKVKPFKCGPPENAHAWALMRDEFFAGVDAVRVSVSGASEPSTSSLVQAIDLAQRGEEQRPHDDDDARADAADDARRARGRATPRSRPTRTRRARSTRR